MIDLICYFMLLGLLILMTRVKPTRKISVRFATSTMPGVILRCGGGVASRVGLLNTPRLNSGDGLFLSGTKSVHTRGMQYPIDILFLDPMGRVLRMELNAVPGQSKIRGPRGTASILELGAGSVETFFPGLKMYSTLEVNLG